MIEIKAEFDRVFAASQSYGIGVLPSFLIRECSTLQEGSLTKIETACDGDGRRPTVGTSERLSQGRRLAKLKFVVAPILEARLIDQPGSECRSNP
jgi:hypothetical protein